MKRFAIHKTKRFGRDENGAALVEFAMTIPILFIIFAVIVEGGRLFWGYQAVIAGVRDAARYVARVAPADICTKGGNLSGYQTKALSIVRTRTGGASVFPGGIVVNSVSVGVVQGASSSQPRCYSAPLGATWAYRGGTVGVAQVTANVTVNFPFRNVFTFFGGSALSNVTTTVTDEQRIYGT